MGLAAGIGALLGVHFDDVSDFRDTDASLGVVLGAYSIELLASQEGRIRGFQFGFLARGIGLGFFGQGLKTILGSITEFPPLEPDPCN